MWRRDEESGEWFRQMYLKGVRYRLYPGMGVLLPCTTVAQGLTGPLHVRWTWRSQAAVRF